MRAARAAQIHMCIRTCMHVHVVALLIPPRPILERLIHGSAHVHARRLPGIWTTRLSWCHAMLVLDHSVRMWPAGHAGPPWSTVAAATCMHAARCAEAVLSANRTHFDGKPPIIIRCLHAAAYDHSRAALSLCVHVPTTCTHHNLGGTSQPVTLTNMAWHVAMAWHGTRSEKP